MNVEVSKSSGENVIRSRKIKLVVTIDIQLYIRYTLGWKGIERVCISHQTIEGHTTYGHTDHAHENANEVQRKTVLRAGSPLRWEDYGRLWHLFGEGSSSC